MAQMERGHEAEQSQRKIKYSSRLMAALNKFAGGMSNDVKNPMAEKYGDAYDYVIKGDAHRLREETEDAIRAYEKAISLNPNFVDAYVGMARSFRRKGDLKRALLAFVKALSLNAFDKDVQMEAGKCYNEAGMPAKGIHHLRQACRLDPSYVEAKFNLALILELQGELNEPAKLYQDILAQDPEFVPAYNNLGSILMRQGDYRASEQMFRTLIGKAPDFSRGYLGLAISLDRSNRTAEALPYYEKLLAMKTNYRNKEYIENRVTSLRKSLGKRVRPVSTACGHLVRVK